jgi:DNA primase
VGLIPEETIQAIKDRTDIVSFIGRYVELKKAGRNFVARCPFHDEKTPSFNVNPERQIFHCFGCQVGGNVISFLMRHEGLTFPEAARNLAGEAGIEIPESDGGSRGISEHLFDANDAAQRIYRAGFTSREGEDARAYLDARGIDAETIEAFGIGYAANSWDDLGRELARNEVSEEHAIAAGLLSERDGSRGSKRGGSYARLRGRVVFPIRDIRDRVIGFGGRAIEKDQEPKYLNTPESPIFHKRDALYGFPQALEGIRRSGRVIICEGYFDRIALARAGMTEALATCGTALTEGHARQLKRRTEQVVLLFDGDAAGQAAVEKALEILLPARLRARAALLPPGEDPDSFLEVHGSDALRKLVDSAPEAIEIVMRNALKQGCATPAEKADVVNHVARYVALYQDPVERVEYARRLALVTSTDPGAVETVVRRAQSDSRGRRGGEAPRADAPAAAPAPPRLVDKPRAGREEQHLHRLTQIAYLHPTLLSDNLLERIDELVPEGSWKAILMVLIDAAQDGRVDDSGAIDLDLLEDRLDDEAAARLRRVAVDDWVQDSDTSPDRMLEDILGWFMKRRRAAEKSQVTREFHNPDADHDDLLARKQKQLEERRKAQGVGKDDPPH